MSNFASVTSPISAGPDAPTWVVEFTANDRAPLSRFEVGYLCVVWLKDGSRMIGTPQRSAQRGKFDLLGWAGHPDAMGQNGVTAVRVDWIRLQQGRQRQAPALAA